MDKETRQLLLYVALGGAAIYLVSKFASNVLAPITQPVSNAIADAYLWWTLPPPMNTTGQYVLQDSGALLNPTSYPVTWISAPNDPRSANYQGQLPTISVSGATYVLGPHDDNGNYPAIPL